MNLPDLDKVIHERARFRILACLTAQPSRKCSFTDLRDALGMTAGNLSSQLSVLEEKGYVCIDKRFEGRKPLTEISLTAEGSRVFSDYLETLDQLIRALKSERGNDPLNAASQADSKRSSEDNLAGNSRRRNR